MADKKVDALHPGSGLLQQINTSEEAQPNENPPLSREMATVRRLLQKTGTEASADRVSTLAAQRLIKKEQLETKQAQVASFQALRQADAPGTTDRVKAAQWADKRDVAQSADVVLPAPEEDPITAEQAKDLVLRMLQTRMPDGIGLDPEKAPEIIEEFLGLLNHERKKQRREAQEAASPRRATTALSLRRSSASFSTAKDASGPRTSSASAPTVPPKAAALPGRAPTEAAAVVRPTTAPAQLVGQDALRPGIRYGSTGVSRDGLGENLQYAFAGYGEYNMNWLFLYMLRRLKDMHSMRRLQKESSQMAKLTSVMSIEAQIEMIKARYEISVVNSELALMRMVYGDVHEAWSMDCQKAISGDRHMNIIDPEWAEGQPLSSHPEILARAAESHRELADYVHNLQQQYPDIIPRGQPSRGSDQDATGLTKGERLLLSPQERAALGRQDPEALRAYNKRLENFDLSSGAAAYYGALRLEAERLQVQANALRQEGKLADAERLEQASKDLDGAAAIHEHHLLMLTAGSSTRERFIDVVRDVQHGKQLYAAAAQDHEKAEKQLQAALNQIPPDPAAVEVARRFRDAAAGGLRRALEAAEGNERVLRWVFSKREPIKKHTNQTVIDGVEGNYVKELRQAAEPLRQLFREHNGDLAKIQSDGRYGQARNDYQRVSEKLRSFRAIFDSDGHGEREQFAKELASEPPSEEQSTLELQSAAPPALELRPDATAGSAAKVASQQQAGTAAGRAAGGPAPAGSVQQSRAAQRQQAAEHIFDYKPQSPEEVVAKGLGRVEAVDRAVQGAYDKNRPAGEKCFDDPEMFSLVRSERRLKNAIENATDNLAAMGSDYDNAAGGTQGEAGKLYAALRQNLNRVVQEASGMERSLMEVAATAWRQGIS